jgi:hypothetical protein
MNETTWKTFSIFSKTDGQRVWRGSAMAPERALWAAGKDGVKVSAETHDVWEAGSYEEARAEREASAKAEQDAAEIAAAQRQEERWSEEQLRAAGFTPAEVTGPIYVPEES